MPEVTLGLLTFVGVAKGGHIEVTALGAGQGEHRPLCGRIMINLTEWTALSQQRDVIDAAGRELARLQRLEEVAKLIGKHWRDQQGVNAGLLDLLAEVTRHG